LKNSQQFLLGSAARHAFESVKRTTERRVIETTSRAKFSRPFHGLAVMNCDDPPAMNCWAILKRPLRGLI